MASFQFDGVNRLIYIVDNGQNVNGIDKFSAQDLYSEWKRWLVSNPENMKYPQAMRSIGGDTITQTKSIAPYIELLVYNGWKIKPYSGNYTLIIEGNLFGTNGEIPFIKADSGTVNIILETTGNALAIETTSNSDIQDIKTMLNILLDVEQGNWEILNNQMIFYKRDGSELMRFNLYDKSGQPSETNVYKRVRQ